MRNHGAGVMSDAAALVILIGILAVMIFTALLILKEILDEWL